MCVEEVVVLQVEADMRLKGMVHCLAELCRGHMEGLWLRLH